MSLKTIPFGLTTASGSKKGSNRLIYGEQFLYYGNIYLKSNFFKRELFGFGKCLKSNNSANKNMIKVCNINDIITCKQAIKPPQVEAEQTLAEMVYRIFTATKITNVQQITSTGKHKGTKCQHNKSKNM